MTGQVFPDLPQTPPPEPPADPPAQEEPAKALTPAREMADALSAPEVETPDVSDSPFCRAMDLIAGGLAVTGVTLHYRTVGAASWNCRWSARSACSSASAPCGGSTASCARAMSAPACTCCSFLLSLGRMP